MLIFVNLCRSESGCEWNYCRKFWGIWTKLCCWLACFYPKKHLFKKVLKKIKERAEKIIIGDPLDDKTQVGPLATKLQVERAEKIIAESIQQGAELSFWWQATQ